MLNPIHAIKQLYQLDDKQNHGIDRQMIEQYEAELDIQLPAPLYHYLLELGKVEAINTSYHHFVEMPFEMLGEYLVIGKTCDDDGVWGIHRDELKKQNPMVQMSRNFDAIEQSEVHWFDELPLAEWLLAMAMVNGVNGGLTHHAQVYDFEGFDFGNDHFNTGTMEEADFHSLALNSFGGDSLLPADLLEKLQQLTTEITELHQPHERFFQADNGTVVIMISLDGSAPTAFSMGSQNKQNFENWIHRLTVAWHNDE